MVIVNIKKEDSKKAFKKEAVFKVPKIKGYPTIRMGLSIKVCKLF